MIREPSDERLRFFAGAAMAASFVTAACGPSDTGPAPVTHPQPVHIGPGQIGTIVGAGERRTDPVDGNADGVVDAPIPALEAHLDSPMDVAFSPAGELFVIDWNGHKIRALDSKGELEFMVGTGKEGDACEAPVVDGKCPIA